VSKHVAGIVSRERRKPAADNARKKGDEIMRDKVALVTGGTSGIGRATALAFARAGAKVVVSGRREKEGQQVVDEIKRAGAEAIFIKADVSNEADVKALVQRTIETYRRLDYAFNNAGVEQAMTPLTEQTEETFEQLMNVNVKGVWLSMKHEIPALLKTGGGAIVNTASVAGLIGFPNMPIYVASKHAVIGLTKSVALEYAKQNVRINAVAPAAIETRMYEEVAATPEIKEMLTASHPVGRIGQPDEVANAVVYLCSDGASFITGHTLTVDGGYTAQ
jgi:NAD(P)-dependent dehydrogenase (short-subunit alcohol dehydrogenase family)